MHYVDHRYFAEWTVLEQILIAALDVGNFEISQVT